MTLLITVIIIIIIALFKALKELDISGGCSSFYSAAVLLTLCFTVYTVW